MNERFPDALEAPRWYILAGFLILAVIVVALHFPRLDSGFVVPLDYEEVHRALAVDLENPYRLFTEPHAGFAYRPLSQSVHYLTTTLGDGDPRIFLVRNLVSHLITTVLVLFLAALLLRSWTGALFAAAFFALHPAAVSMVSVPVYQAYGTLFPVLAALAAVFYVDREGTRSTWVLTVSITSISVSPWLSENGLWLVAPATIFALWLRSRSDRNWLPMLVVPWVSAIAFLLLRNEVVSIASQILAVQDASTYGLKSLFTILSNMVIYQVGTAMPFDYLLGIDPLTQGLSRSQLLSESASLIPRMLAVAGAFVVASATYVGLGLCWVNNCNRRLVIVASVMLMLFWLASSLKIVFAHGTEMYVYGGSPWWAIGMTAVAMAALARIPITLRIPARRLLALFAVGLLVGYGYAVHVRVGTLVEKADRLEMPRELAQGLLKASRGENGAVAIVVSCRIPFGFSVYGLNGGSAVLLHEYRALNFGDRADTVSGFRAGTVSTEDLFAFGARVVFVDETLMATVDAKAAATENEACATRTR